MKASSKGKHLFTLAAAATLLGVAPLLSGAQGGCKKEHGDTLKSPVQGIATLLERNDGSVDVDVTIISTASEAVFVETATEVKLRVPGGTQVPLVQTSPGHYTASSTSDPDLVYQGGQRYKFSFQLDDEELAGSAAGKEFYGVIDAPDDSVTFEITRAPQFAQDTWDIAWTPTNRAGILTVRNEEGNVTYSTFYLDQAAFAGDKWSRLLRGGSQGDLTGSAFPAAGNYTVSFCAVSFQQGFDQELAPDLGLLSGFLAGRCAPDTTVAVPE